MERRWGSSWVSLASRDTTRYRRTVSSHGIITRYHHALDAVRPASNRPHPRLSGFPSWRGRRGHHLLIVHHAWVPPEDIDNMTQIRHHPAQTPRPRSCLLRPAHLGEVYETDGEGGLLSSQVTRPVALGHHRRDHLHATQFLFQGRARGRARTWARAPAGISPARCLTGASFHPGQKHPDGSSDSGGYMSLPLGSEEDDTS